MTGPALLIDTMSLIYRAHHLAPPALAGLAAHVEELRRELAAERVAFALDLPDPSFRRDLSPGYKSRRRRTPRALVEQLPRLDACLTDLGGEIHRAAGYEADDVLATLARELRERGAPGVVATCDRDLIALAHGGIEVLHLGQHRDGRRRYDAIAVERRFGVTPQQYGSWLALKGKGKDGVPGVPGLHPRDAARVVREWGSAEAVVEHLAAVRPPTLRRLLAAHADRIRHNARVLGLRDDVPLLSRES
jgi:DNA polymerase-1